MLSLKKKNWSSLLIITILFTIGCSSGFQKSPLDEVIRDLPKDEVFSIILNDMDAQGTFSKTYYHQYEIIKGNDPDQIASETTDFLKVSEDEFNRYINDMGMEIAARDSTGKLTKSVAPPGYNNYVGNPRYGSWQTNSSGGSFWAFYGQYAFMSSMFRTAMYPVHRSYYNDWRGSYYGTGRPYYGPTNGGYSYYGTNSSYSQTKNPSSSWNSKSSSFKNRVQSRASRSSGSSGSKSSGYRSKGGSFGK